MRLAVTALAAALLAAPVATQAAPLTPFPAGGFYQGETLRFQGQDYFLEVLMPTLTYSNVVMGDFHIDGGAQDGLPDDYRVDLLLESDNACFIGWGLCGTAALSGTAFVRGQDLGGGMIETEMVQMVLSGGVATLPSTLREVPGLPSLGQATTGGGPLQIDSFFDIFVEISVAGRQMAPDIDGPSHFTLQSVEAEVPEPATLGMLGVGLVGLAAAARARRRRS